MNKHANSIESVGSAFKGLRHGLAGRNYRLHLLAGAVAIFLAYYLPLTTTERYFILILIGMVLAAELFNSAIEELADVLIQEHHPGIARVKELSAAAVLILAVIAAVIGFCIFVPYLA